MKKSIKENKKIKIGKQRIPTKEKPKLKLISQQLLQAKPIIYFQEQIGQNNGQNQMLIKQLQDNRILKNSKIFPYTAIGCLKIKFKYKQQQKIILNNGIGTGFIVGKNLVLTVAHNIYDKKTRTKACQAFFYLGVENIFFSTQIKVAQIYFPQKYKYNSEPDYALLVLDTEEDLTETYGSFALATWFIEQGQKAQIAGFPSDKNKNNEINLYGCSNSIGQVQNQIFEHFIDTNNGQSGSPIFRYSKIFNQYEVIGIHTGRDLNTKKNYGKKISLKTYDQINQWLKCLKQHHQHKKNFKPIEQNSQNIQLMRQYQIPRLSKIQNLKKKQNELLYDTQEQLLLESEPEEQQYTSNWNKVWYYTRLEMGYDSVNKKKGQAYLQKNKPDKAKKCYIKALKIFQRTHSKESLQCAQILFQLSKIYQSQGQNFNSLFCLKKSEEIKKKQYNIKFFKNKFNMLSQAYFLEKKGNLVRKCEEELISIEYKFNNKNSNQCINSLVKIGQINNKHRKFDTALKYFEDALFKMNQEEIKIETYQKIMYHIGQINWRKNQYIEAQLCFNQCLQSVSQQQRNISQFYILIKKMIQKVKYKESIAQLQDSLKFIENDFKKDSFQYLQVLIEIATKLFQQQRTQEAEEKLQECQELYEKIKIIYPLQIEKLLKRFANIYLNYLKNYKKVLLMYNDALQQSQLIMGKFHIENQKYLSYIAHILLMYKQDKQPKEIVRGLYERSYQIFKKSNDLENVKNLENAEYLGRYFDQENNKKQALQYYKLSRRIYQKNFPDHQDNQNFNYIIQRIEIVRKK